MWCTDFIYIFFAAIFNIDNNVQAVTDLVKAELRRLPSMSSQVDKFEVSAVEETIDSTTTVTFTITFGDGRGN